MEVKDVRSHKFFPGDPFPTLLATSSFLLEVVLSLSKPHQFDLFWGGADSDQEFESLLKQHEHQLDEEEKEKEERKASRSVFMFPCDPSLGPIPCFQCRAARWPKETSTRKSTSKS